LLVLQKKLSWGNIQVFGPTDPWFGPFPASAVLEEFAAVKKEVIENPATIKLWQIIISKYHPTLLGECEKDCKWTEKTAASRLEDNMFCEDSDAK
jgi:hypothetical protein